MGDKASRQHLSAEQLETYAAQIIPSWDIPDELIASSIVVNLAPSLPPKNVQISAAQTQAEAAAQDPTKLVQTPEEALPLPITKPRPLIWIGAAAGAVILVALF